MPAAAFFAKSLYTFNSSTINCTFNVTTSQSPNNPNADICNDDVPVWIWVAGFVPIIAIPLVALVIAIIIDMRRRRSRRNAEPTPGDECQEEVKQNPTSKPAGFGSSTDFSESATKVLEDDKEDDISSYTHSIVYRHSKEHSVMQFFKMGLFRAASSMESQGALPSGGAGVSDSFDPGVSGVHGFYDYHEDPQNHVVDNDPGMFHPPTPAFHTSPSRPRSLSEGTIIAPTKFSTMSPILTPPLPSSLPSSPSICAGTDYQSCHSTFSLSLSERLEKLNKQIQKKASSSSLKASKAKSEKQATFAVTLNEAGSGAFEMGSSNKRKGNGHIPDDDSMDFKCCGLPESGTFSNLTEAEAAMRAEDELATRQRLEGKIF
ncbi:hypothetical protein AX14_012192 [Amanita brunnescens Koide BX004]|nr:hypothetical protein AX14_012192 [Amanita brunnescens Koide BX004]